MDGGLRSGDEYQDIYMERRYTSRERARSIKSISFKN